MAPRLSLTVQGAGSLEFQALAARPVASTAGMRP